MAGKSKILPVPYFTQPTGITCQSTCLKMFAGYLSTLTRQSTEASDRAIQDIWKDINTGAERPSKVRNAHTNLKWWLQKHFPRIKFEYLTVRDELLAVISVVGFIEAGYPVLMSVSHAGVAGHIILVVGYENYLVNQSTADFKLVAHDPYGRFDPSLSERLFGKNRWQGGSSLMGGGEKGPGAYNRLDVEAVSRRRKGDKAAGTFYLLSASR